MDIIDQLVEITQVTSSLSKHLGRSYGSELGMVSDRDDPLKLGRIKCTTAAKGGKFTTGWLFRRCPSPAISFPVPSVGNTVVIDYIDGDQHMGIYSVLQNNINVAGPVDEFSFRLNGALVRISESGDVTITTEGAMSITTEGDVNLNAGGTLDLSAGNIKLTAGSVAIAGKEVATVGAKDSANHTLVEKGW